jgi:hypothetical protein
MHYQNFEIYIAVTIHFQKDLGQICPYVFFSTINYASELFTKIWSITVENTTKMS